MLLAHGGGGEKSGSFSRRGEQDRSALWNLIGKQIFSNCSSGTVGTENFSESPALRENGLHRPAKGGSTPAFAYQRAAIAPLPCPNLQPYCFMIQLYLNWTVLKNAIAAGKTDSKNNLLRKCGLLAHTSAAFLKNCCTEKLLFACGSVIAADMEKQLIFTNCFMWNIALGRAACPPF